MFTRSLDEEPPELPPVSVKHTELERYAQKSFRGIQAMILMRLGHVLRRALQRVDRAAIVLARLVNSPHDSLIPGDEFLGVHFGNKVKPDERVVASRIVTEQSSFSFEASPKLRVRKRVEHSHHRHRNRTLADKRDLTFEDVVG